MRFLKETPKPYYYDTRRRPVTWETAVISTKHFTLKTFDAAGNLLGPEKASLIKITNFPAAASVRYMRNHHIF